MRAALLKVTGYREKQEIGRGSLCSGHLVTQTEVVIARVALHYFCSTLLFH